VPHAAQQFEHRGVREREDALTLAGKARQNLKRAR
jgi:hypothetical protein